MKLILTQEVAGLGAPGDVVEVKDGYGRNYLVPRGVAHPLDPRRREDRRVDQGRPAPRRAVRDQDHADEIKAKLEAAPVNVQVRPATAAACSAPSPSPRSPARSPRSSGEARSTSARSRVGNPIKSLGAHQVTVKLHDDVSATVALNVVPA